MLQAVPTLEPLRVRALAPQGRHLAGHGEDSTGVYELKHKQQPQQHGGDGHVEHPIEEEDIARETPIERVESAECGREEVDISVSDSATDKSQQVSGEEHARHDPEDEAAAHAEPIAFPMLAIDRYGFLITDKRYNKGIPDATQKQLIWLENRRTQKWVKMIGKQLEDWEVCQLKNASKLKQRIRKGIPEALRGRVWCHLAGSTQMLHNNPGVFRDFLQVKKVPCEETIARDIGRTFPKHYLFNDRASMGQCALMNVLKAYSLHDPDVGYCQGMGFLTAMFLSYMPEEPSFWHLVACLNHKRYDMAGLYRPRMPKVPEVIYIFEQLMKQMMPQLAAHMENEGMHPTMYLTQWFITLFTYNFPFEFVTRVWDVYLNEGWKVIFRISLALMKLSQKTLLSIKFEGIMEFFRELPTKVNTEEVFSVAFRLPLKRARIEALREAYELSTSTKA